MAWDCNLLSKLAPPGKSSCLAPGDTSPFLNIKNQSYIHPEPVVQFLDMYHEKGKCSFICKTSNEVTFTVGWLLNFFHNWPGRFF